MSITMDEGIAILRHIERIVSEFGAHAAITGGTVFYGSSDKDVDIIIYPHKTKIAYDKYAIIEAICDNSISPPTEADAFGGIISALADEPNSRVEPWLTNILENSPSRRWYQCNSAYVDKDVVITVINGVRVDLIFT